MSDERITVHVVQERDRENLSMRFKDPITGKTIKRSAGTSKRKDALKEAAKWEAELREGRYHSPIKVTWDEVIVHTPGTSDGAGWWAR